MARERGLKRRGWSALLAGVVVLGAAGGARAQLLGDEPNVVEELVVQGKLPGPAWWVVEDADTKIYVLGAPDVATRGMAWDQSILERRMDGAFALITPPYAKAGVSDIPAMIRLLSELKSKTPLSQVMPPDDWARLEKARVGLSKRPGTYEKYKPLGAVFFLASDFRKQTGLTDDGGVSRAVVKSARRHGVKTREAASYKAMPYIQDFVANDTTAVGLTCLRVELARVERGPEIPRAAAAAWARGDVPGALPPRLPGFEACRKAALEVPGGARFAALEAQAREDQTQAFIEALKTPGHAVAVMEVRQLVATDGVLARLKARGFTVRTPAE